jgi:peptidoglycan/xylan/chitin deacetylase (PgdA/CDA1 family)
MSFKPILEIHEWKPEFESLPLEDYILTFDDGLYSQYQARDFLKTLNTPKIFFISTNIIREENERPNLEIIHCKNAHIKAFKGNFEDYMNWWEIWTLQDMGFEIGGHSHFHKRYNISPLKELYQNLILDTEIMMENFEQKNIKINKFCFPYNETYNSLYRTIISKNGLESFGPERMPIEKLLEELK